MLTLPLPSYNDEYLEKHKRYLKTPKRFQKEKEWLRQLIFFLKPGKEIKKLNCNSRDFKSIFMRIKFRVKA